MSTSFLVEVFFQAAASSSAQIRMTVAFHIGCICLIDFELCIQLLIFCKISQASAVISIGDMNAIASALFGCIESGVGFWKS